MNDQVWQPSRIGDVAEILSGFAFPSTRFSEFGGLPLVRIRDIGSETTEVNFVGGFDARFVIGHGATLIGMDGDFHVRRWRGSRALLNQRVCCVFSRQGKSDDSFLFWRLKPLVEEIHRRTPQTTVRHLAASDVTETVVALPPLAEQRAIAAVLDTIDDAIQKTEQIIAKLNQVKQGLLHDLLTRGIDDKGELRDPERHPEQFQDSPLGRIPKGWAVVQLGTLSVGGLVNGVFKAPSRAGRGMPLVNVGDLYAEFGIDVRRVDRFAATPVEEKKFAVAEGDIYFTRSSLNLAGIAQCNIVRYVPEPSVFECHVMRLRPNLRQVDPAFVGMWCRSRFARAFFMARAKQVTMTTIAQPDIFSLPTPCPPVQEQGRIVAAVDAMDERLAKESALVDKLRRAKSGIAEDLLTGRVRTMTLGEVGA